MTVNCSHCDNAPELRHSPDGKLMMWICPVCNNRGVATSSERYAAATWELVNSGGLPSHNGTGRPRFFQKAGKWGVRCTLTAIVDYGYHTIEGAVYGWMRLTRNPAKGH